MGKNVDMVPLEAVTQKANGPMWLQTRDGGELLKVYYLSEHMPYLKFIPFDGAGLIKCRPEYYGKTWRCFDWIGGGLPAGAVSDWEEV